ncbi:MAG: hypothetical protein JW807_09715 [Spirochaetes bacterium]|nr:hypothetical protein [Spirochaetota bacterium]
MVIVQFLKILFFIAFVYMLYNLIRYLFRLGKTLNERRQEEEKIAGQRTSRERFRTRNRKETIELDKDQYKVE